MSGPPQGDAEGYPVLEGRWVGEHVVNKSRFICALEPVRSEAAAQAVIDAARAAHPGANHHCYAYLIGPPGSSARVGLSDDGEPHGVAGRPMLKVLSGCGLGDLVAVVSRYFGGIKLGRGGMLRAYSQAVQDTLAAAPRGFYQELASLQVALGYAEAEAARRLYPSLQVRLVEERFGAQVDHQLEVPKTRRAAAEQALHDLCRGQLSVRRD